MFGTRENRTPFGSFMAISEVTYHATVRFIQKSHGNGLIALFLSVVQTALFVLFFYAMYALLGMRGAALRGDFILYLISGVFLFLTHIKTVSAIIQSDGPSSGIMKHAPMNTAVAVMSAALGTLYIQVLSLALILFIYHAAVTPITIAEPVGALMMLLGAWFSGLAVGLIFYAIKPWAPNFARIASMVYNRANMIASGKMFVANNIPTHILAFFDWNPLFHYIDQCRGFMFQNYSPHYSSVSYPVIVTLALFAIGLMGEFYTRRRSSISWMAKH